MMTDEVVSGFPLKWPMHWPRTASGDREYAMFRQTMGRAVEELIHEIGLLGGESVIISSDLQLRRDGLPWSGQRDPDDPGIAVYFRLFGKQQCIPCDKWKRVTDNIIAVQKTVNALRGIERWGAKRMVEAAFQGFAALPAAGESTASGKLYFSDCRTAEERKEKYKRLIKELHPDAGGNQEEFVEMRRQFTQAQLSEVKF